MSAIVRWKRFQEPGLAAAEHTEPAGEAEEDQRLQRHLPHLAQRSLWHHQRLQVGKKRYLGELEQKSSGVYILQNTMARGGDGNENLVKWGKKIVIGRKSPQNSKN